ncbi:MAG TPA: hypothetical protein DCG69_12895 [Bacteroidales bacterium]|nr:hypothetical protein [Bacteroidales bacterium]
MNVFLKPYILIILVFFVFATQIAAQEKRSYTTKKISGESPKVDGLLDDSAWEQGKWEDSFTQYQPLNGGEPDQETLFNILYDDDFIYIAVKALDRNPEEIVKRMSRRDAFQGDWIEIAFDSYHDFSTAYSFTATVAGVKNDEKYSGDNFHSDRTWDPIWYLKTSIDKEGWIAEIKIPFTQLRFSEETHQIWGLQVKRYVHRKDERSLWQAISNQEAGYVSRFGELHGLENIKPKKQFDITPYAVASAESFQKEEGDPFTDGKELHGRVGLDAKIGLTNNLTLDLTINPDFGQVEADPSEVNLSAFESYFEEKRLFFIEGRNIYNFPLRLGEGNNSSGNLFYSRRIGKKPSYYPETYNFLDMPENTSILGAAKITGKTKSGLSIGVLESVTNVEHARISLADNSIEKYTVEPLTNYFVSRIEKDFNQGNTKIGGMITATNRKIDDVHLEILPTAAYTGGLNFDHQWKDRKYTFSIKLLGSHIQGSTQAISDLQLASARYYQRPDSEHTEFSPNLKTLSGHSGSVWMGKQTSGGWSYIAWYSWQSPGFELNDLGYLREADDMTEIVWAEYNIPKPISVFRKLSMEAVHYSSYDFSGKYLGMGGDMNISSQFNNFWSVSMGGNYNTSHLSKTLLRGGPLFKNPPTLNYWGNISSDRRKNLNVSLNISSTVGAENSSLRKNYSMSINYRPVDQLLVSLQPSLRHNSNQLQYIGELNIAGQDRYFLAEIKQKTFVAQLRMDYGLTPDFSIQFYAQPFISTGEYSNFKYVTNPIASVYSDRFMATQPDENFGIDMNTDGIVDGYLENPNFKFIQFQSNLVARWEYLPGSTIYLVWSQNKTDFPDQYAFDFYNDMDNLFSIYPHNIFLLKFSHRIPI